MEPHVFDQLWQALDAGLALQSAEPPAVAKGVPADPEQFLSQRAVLADLRARYESHLHALRFYAPGWACRLEQTLAQLGQLSLGDHDDWLARQALVVAPASSIAARALALRMLIAARRAEALTALGEEEAAAEALAEARRVAAARARGSFRWRDHPVEGPDPERREQKGDMPLRAAA